MNKREQQKETTLQDILRVSAQLFQETGYEKTTITHIARDCGLSKGALYHHFRSKEEVLERICLDQYRLMQDTFLPLVENKRSSMKDKIKSIMTIVRGSSMNTAAVTYEGLEKVPLISTENAAMEKLFDFYSEKLYRELFAPILDEGRAGGECSFSASAETMALFIHHMDSGMTNEIKRIFKQETEGAEAALRDVIQGFTYALSRLLNMSEESIADITLADTMLTNFKSILDDNREKASL